ncbi:unnamed protein product [Orchesella dallaii]|uniref:Uncharacterized protein n=1 Tax=Orchesella dallaii TaxID=48710 RepID=A0ABP1PJU2_9HEXA
MPRYHLKLDKMFGRWYPVLLTRTAANLWSESFGKDHPGTNTSQENCFFVDYKMSSEEGNFSITLDMTLSRGNLSTTLEAILLADEKHPGFSKWVIPWPNGENTLTAIVAVGPEKVNQTRYTWLLTVDCDLKGIVLPDWTLLARVEEEEGISNATIHTISHIVDGIHGLHINDTLSHQPSDCIMKT